MKNKKNIIILLTMTVFIIVFITKNKYKNHSQIKANRSWTTYQRDPTSSKELNEHQTTDIELTKIKAKNNSTTIRKIDKKADYISKTYKGRELIGIEKFNLNDYPKGFTNIPKKNWKKILAKGLMKFQTSNTLLFIKEEKKLIGLKNTRPIYLEQVIITYLLPNGNKNTFRALVDSEHGNLTTIWNKTKREDFLKEERRPL
jgi:hypothetical protein